MASYSSAASGARNPRRRHQDGSVGERSGPSSLSSGISGTANSRPSHLRQHSANTAGDVFAMLGKPAASSREREKVRERQDSSNSNMSDGAGASSTADQSKADQTPMSSPLSPVTGSPSGPSSSFGRTASSKRYKTLYTKPVLLKLWSTDRSVDIPLEDVHSAFELPDKNAGQGEENYPQQRYQTSNHLGERAGQGPYNRRSQASDFAGPGERGNRAEGGASRFGVAHVNGLGGALGRRPDRFGHIGIQGGVLPGAGGPGPGHGKRTLGKEEEDGAQGPLEQDRPHQPRSSRMASYGANVKEDRDKGPASAGPAWTANRWRHLQTEDDTQSGSGSGSSSRDGSVEEPEDEPWSTKGEWRPTGQDRLREERPPFARQLSRGDKSSLWDTPDKKGVHVQAEGNGSSKASTPAKASLWTDDLLGPTGNKPAHLPSAFPSEAHPIAQALAIAPNPSLSTVTDTIGRLSLDREAFLGSSMARRPSDNGASTAGMTPTRAQASEGLDILARRSPVQDLSMAQLQQQSYMQQQLYAAQQHTSRSHSMTPPPRPPMNPESIFWHYKDPTGQVQGPFPATQMQEWYLQGFFNETLQVRRVESPEYETLGALVMRLGDPSKPFLSAPAPRMYGPPGMLGMGQPISHSPALQRVASPAAWQQSHSLNTSLPQPSSQTSSRNASISGGFQSYQDVYSPHPNPVQPQVNSPFATHMLALAQQVPQPVAQAQSVPLDPWADTLHSPVVSRSTSQHGLSEAGNPHEAPHLPQPIAPIGRAPSVPVPAIRTASSLLDMMQQSGTPKEAVPVHSDASPQASTQSLPVSQSAKQDAPRAAKQQQNSANAYKAMGATTVEDAYTKTAPIPAPKAVQSGATAIELPTLQKPLPPSSPSKPSAPAPRTSSSSVPAKKESPSTKATSPAAPAAVAAAPSQAKSTAPATSALGKVSITSQEAFQKQKSGVQAAPNSIEMPFPSDALAASASKAAPWAKSAEDIGTPSTPSLSIPALSLKEIQAKEAKEAAARKAAEKRAHAAQIAAEEAALAGKQAKEAAESLPSSSTWGVPSPAAPAPASTSSPWAKPAAPAVQTAATGPRKKTLKEIQEEEEAGRKRAAAAAQAASLPTAGKGYAGVSRAAGPSPANVNAGGVWTTVGTPKAATPVTATTTAKAVGESVGQPKAITPSTSSSSLASRLAGGAAATRPAAASSVSSPALKTVPNGRAGTPGPRSDDANAPASPELLKWCREALKGLDIPVDDFVQMLLSFPVPLDKSTRELISDSVYSSSRTLDGRHFADAFADKRAADLKAIKAGRTAPAPPPLAPAKPVSFTDAIKFVPNKPQEPNFKIVTKKQGKAKK